MKLTIETPDASVLKDIFETKESPARGSKKSLSEDASITYEGTPETRIREAVGIPIPFEFVLDVTSHVASCVAAAVIADFLIKKLKGKKIHRISIGKMQVHLEHGEITKVLIEKLESEHE